MSDDWASAGPREAVTIVQITKGLYAIKREGQPTLIGGAASTILTLSHLVFGEEALLTPNYIQEDKK